MKVSAVILAGGSGTRFGENKLLYKIDGTPVIRRTLERFCGLAEEIILVAHPDFLHEFEAASSGLNIKMAAGGISRFDSVKNGLAAVTGEITLIHDGARPFLSAELIERVIADVKEYGSGVAAVKTTDTVAETAGGKIIKTLCREGLYNIQTPQGYLTAEIKKAYERADGDFTDDSSVYLSAGLPRITEGEYGNRKITVKDDLKYFDADADERRIGSSFDVHKLAEGRRLLLGGVHIPYEKGLLGHSDADVIIHAVMGAVLNAMGLRDIGTYFPDTDPAFKNADSTDLLAAVLVIMRGAGYDIVNASFTVIAEQPKLAPHIDLIKQNLSRLLSLPPEKIGLAATTAEGIGDIGRGDSIACTGHVLLKKDFNR